MKAQAWAPINLALIKYWGKVDEQKRLPANSSLSINLSNLGTTTAVEFKKDWRQDRVRLDGKELEGEKKDRVIEQLDRVRQLAKINWRAQVESKNEIAMGVGLSSSASGMAALSLAATAAANLKLKTKDLSRLARLGSGSACRSIPDGWVEWLKGSSDKTSYAQSIFPADWWDIRVLVVFLSQKEKTVSSTAGQALAATSPFFQSRLKGIKPKIKEMKQVIKDRNFPRLGELVEAEALSLHAIMLTSQPSLVYWLPETVRVIRAVRDWRQAGLEGYFTINTGQNVFVLSQPKQEAKWLRRLKKIEGVLAVKQERIGKGARLI
jgi:diphosphomevalonate decarboxylase